MKKINSIFPKGCEPTIIALLLITIMSCSRNKSYECVQTHYSCFNEKHEQVQYKFFKKKKDMEEFEKNSSYEIGCDKFVCKCYKAR